MICRFTSLLSIFFVLGWQTPPKGEAVVFRMYQRYSGKWYRTFYFDQQTIRYDKGATRKSIWHEYTEFPDKFRIDFGSPAEKNTAIFTRDSIFRFKKGALVFKGRDENELTFLLGGFYFMPFDGVKQKMKRLGYDLSATYETTWDHRPVFVVGAGSASQKSNQFWVDEQHLFIVRTITFRNGQKEELRFFDHKRMQQGWSETRVEAYDNDTLSQRETYFNCRVNLPFRAHLFDPAVIEKDLP